MKNWIFDSTGKTAFFFNSSLKTCRVCLSSILSKAGTLCCFFAASLTNVFPPVRPIVCEIENVDRKRKTAFFDLDFPIRKKSYLILRKAIYFFLIEKSRSKNAVFRFRSRIRSGLRSLIFFLSGCIVITLYWRTVSSLLMILTTLTTLLPEPFFILSHHLNYEDPSLLTVSSLFHRKKYKDLLN